MGKAEPLCRPIKDEEVKVLKVKFAGKQDAAATATTAEVGDKKKHQKEKKDETGSVTATSPINNEELYSLIQSLNDQIKKVGDSIRTLKAAKAPKVKEIIFF